LDPGPRIGESVPLHVGELDDRSVEGAGALMAREHSAAKKVLRELPEAYLSLEVCVAGLKRLRDSGHRGLVATDRGRVLAVAAATVRQLPVIGRYAKLPAEGLAVDPDLADPTAVLSVLWGELAQPLVADGVSDYYLVHPALPRLHEALSNIGFGRDGCYAVRRVAASGSTTTRSTAGPSGPAGSARAGDAGIAAVRVRRAGDEDLPTVARLALVELHHRGTPPMFAPPDTSSLDEVIAVHGRLREAGAVHLLAHLDGHDVGLLTVELTSPAPRLCPEGQPFIGPTGTLPEARRRGVGQALLAAALDWAQAHGYQWISVDFDTGNPLSRPFWSGAGFHPTGYGLARHLHR
jgi:GNAT superfamily N-acetyltransferase